MRGIVWIAGVLAATPAAAEVRVSYVNPQGFTDAGLFAPGPVDQDAPALVGLRRILERAGQRLPPGQDLTVEVLDVDLAGYLTPWRSPPSSYRVMDPGTWPRIRLRYTLTQDGRTLASGEELVSDMSYLRRPAVMRSTAPLRFEEPMMMDWFVTTLAGGQRR